MLTDEYRDFKARIKDGQVPAIQRKLGYGVRSIAWDLFGEAGQRRPDALNAFFTAVIKRTGEKVSFDSDNYYDDLVKKWKNAGNKTLAVATYYYLYTLRSGQELAESIDRSIFDGKRFCEYHHVKVRGGYCDGESLAPADLADNPSLILSPPPLSSQKLHYSNRLVESVIGRDQEQETLRRFVESGPGFRWFQIAGAGGQGKSRLALELMENLVGWEKGFLRKADLEGFDREWAAWLPKKPHLIIIDYIIGYEEKIGAALKKVAGLSRSKPFDVPICFLIVERQSWNKPSQQVDVVTERSSAYLPKISDWFRRLNAVEGDDIARPEFRFETGLVELSKLETGALIAIVRAIAGKKCAAISDEYLAATLQKIDKSGRPLYAHLFAEALGYDKFAELETREDLLTFILEREREKRWLKISGESAPTLADDHPAILLAVLATMLREVSEGQSDKQCFASLFDTSTLRLASSIVDMQMTDTVAGFDRSVRGLEPDILGEWLVILALSRSRQFEAITRLAWELNPPEMGAFMLRLAQDFAQWPLLRDMAEIEPEGVSAKSTYAMVALAILPRSWDDMAIQGPVTADIFNEFRPEEAMYRLAIFYSNRLDRAKDKLSFIWFLRAAQCGHPKSMYWVGWSHMHGIGVKKDKKEALFWWKEGLKNHDTSSIRSLGSYYAGLYRGVPRLKKSFQYYKIAAELGCGQSMGHLGICYLNGLGVRRSRTTARQWLEKGKAAGDDNSITALLRLEGLPAPWEVEEATDF